MTASAEVQAHAEIEDLVGQAWPGVPQTPEIWIAADLLAKLAEGSS